MKQNKIALTNQYETKRLQNIIEFTLSWPCTAQHQTHPWVRQYWRKVIFSFVSLCQLQIAFWLRVGAYVHFPPPHVQPVQALWMFPQSLQSKCVSPVVSGRPSFLRVIHHPSDSYFITLLLPLPPGSLSAESRDLMETSHLRLNVPKSVPVCTQSSCGSLYFFPWLQKEASLKMAEQGTDLWIYQSILNVILLLYSYSRATEFGFPLGPWPIQSLVLGYLSSVRHGRNTNLTTWKNTVCLPSYFARYTFFIITGL